MDPHMTHARQDVNWRSCATSAGQAAQRGFADLVFYARLVQVVAADCTGVRAYCPAPHCHSTPLLYLKALARALAFALGLTII